MGRINVTFTIFADLRDPTIRGNGLREAKRLFFFWRVRGKNRRGGVVMCSQ